MRVTAHTRQLWEALRVRLQKACPAGTVTERDAFEWLLHEDARREAEALKTSDPKKSASD